MRARTRTRSYLPERGFDVRQGEVPEARAFGAIRMLDGDERQVIALDVGDRRCEYCGPVTSEGLVMVEVDYSTLRPPLHVDL